MTRNHKLTSTSPSVDRRTFLKAGAAMSVAIASLADPLHALGYGTQTSHKMAAQQAGVVNLFMSSSPDTFLPHYSIGAYSRYIGQLIFPRLLRYQEDASVVPYLAESFEVSDDGLVYTFSLVQDAVWSDGTPVTANDVAWTYTMAFHGDYTGTRQVEAPVAGGQAYREGTADSVSGIVVVDDHTIQFTLERPTSSFVENVAQFFWILPAHAFEGTEIIDIAKHEMARNPTVTAGPLNFVRYETDQYVELAANPNFILGQPKIDTFIVKILRNDVALAQFETKEMDATTKVGVMLPQDVASLEGMGLQVTPVPGSALQSMGINNDRECFQDKRVRQAMAHAIDRQAIIDSLLMGYGQILNAKVPTFSPYYNPETAGLLQYDPDLAKQLLEEAGWDFNREITLFVPTGNVTRERSGPIIQQYLQAVGMKVKMETMEFATQSARVDAGEADLWLVGSSFVTFDPDQTSSFHSASLPPSGWNSWRWMNPEADQAMDDGLAAVTFEERKEANDRLQMIMADDVPVVFLYHPEDIHVISTRLQNATPTAVGIEWNIQDWELTQ
ncbi:MAG: ABC transporter substrate-binding protein [Thermomicrobiales bacterium]|nr:ABC transporter substrate-binding protein [Thermomicrobiales bacterium]MCO5225217.1 ABC transporter substrate-binding protein [Thermomicrobiales bacterium]MCO5227038.1 ABC transporter substrate-binding protein [Thermomicrobiales bacterium]